MKQTFGKKFKKIIFYTLYVPCVLLDAICKDAAAVCGKVKVIFANKKALIKSIKADFESLTASARVLFKNRAVLFASLKADIANMLSGAKRFKIRKASGLQRSNTKTRTPLNRKMFASTATLIVSAILLITVSYGQYRIMIPGEIRMPKAASFTQHAYLYPSLDNYNNKNENGSASATDLYGVNYADYIEGSEPQLAAIHYGQTYASSTDDIDKDLHADLVYDMYLNDLQPGDEVQTIVDIYNELTSEERKTNKTLLSHTFKFEIENKNAGSTVNQIPSEYTIRIETGGWIKMKMVLIDDETGTMYYSNRKNNGNTYYFYPADNDFESDNNKEIVFSFDSLDDVTRNNDVRIEANRNDFSNTQRSYTVFVGWDNSYDPNNPNGTNSLTKASMRKELEVLNVRADVVSTKVQNTPFGLSKDNEWTEATLQERLREVTQNSPAASNSQKEGEAYVPEEDVDAAKIRAEKTPLESPKGYFDVVLWRAKQ